MRLHPGVKIAIGPPIADGFYYDFEFPEPISEADLAAIEEEMRREIAEGRSWAREEISREEALARFEAESQPYKVELAREAEGADLALHAGRLHRPLPRAAPPGRLPDQGAQADEPRRRVLARRREEHAADADLRHRVLLAGRPRRPPRAARAGARARPPPPRPRARPLPSLRALARVAVLAPEGDGDLERARGPAPAGEPKARLPRGEDAAPLRPPDVHHLGPLRELRGEHVLRAAARGRGADGAEADELPRPHAALRLAAPLLPRPSDPLRGVLDAAPRRARRDAPRAPARQAHHAGRRARLRAPRTRSRTRSTR